MSNELVYDDYVKLGKEIVDQVKDKQIKICALAMKVCTIRHGGRSSGYYTMTDYAKDIGLNNKTLNQWMLIYRNVVMKLSELQRESLIWNNASRVENILAECRTIDNSIDGKKRRKNFKDKIPKERVQKLYNDFTEAKPFENEFINMVQHMKSFKALLEKRDLSIIDEKRMLFFMEILDECSDIVNDHLTNKKRKTA